MRGFVFFVCVVGGGSNVPVLAYVLGGCAD